MEDNRDDGVILCLWTAASKGPIVHSQGDTWPRRNDIDREILLIHPPELSGNPTSNHLVANQKEHVEGNDEFGLWNAFILTSKSFLHEVKSYYMGTVALLPHWRNVCCGFLSPLTIHRLGRVWTLGPIASTIIITPPRRLNKMIVQAYYKSVLRASTIFLYFTC
jgi:hypothetical protein